MGASIVPESELKNVSETLYIPLYGKAEAAKYGDFIRDTKAEEIVRLVSYDFSKNNRSRFLSIYMAIRAAILDDYAVKFIEKNPDGVVFHLGCGLDSRAERIPLRPYLWVDIDLPDVIEVRRRYFSEREGYKMLAASATDESWLSFGDTRERPVLVIAEGLTMYFTDEENKALFSRFASHFTETEYVFDAYSISAVGWSKRKNPVNKMGAKILWGLDDPGEIERAVPEAVHVQTQYFTGRKWYSRLSGFTRLLFRALYGSAWANSLYRVYCFKISARA